MVRELDAGIYGPGSVTWRVNREQVMLLGGGMALLLQVAHPLVAAGVDEHSTFKQDPLRRLNRTLEATLAIVFGTAEDAERAAAQIRAVHARVRGVLHEGVGAYPAGTAYDARDPDLLLWVHATLVNASLRAYEAFVRPFAPGERERYYEDTKVAARMLGVPDPLIPPTLEEFAAYFDDMLASDRIAVGAVGRDLARHVLYPTLRLVPRPLFSWLSLITIGLLPEAGRRKYGFPWDASRERAFRRRAAFVRRTVPALPPALRLFPQARAAERRLLAG